MRDPDISRILAQHWLNAGPKVNNVVCFASFVASAYIILVEQKWVFSEGRFSLGQRWVNLKLMCHIFLSSGIPVKI